MRHALLLALLCPAFAQAGLVRFDYTVAATADTARDRLQPDPRTVVQGVAIYEADDPTIVYHAELLASNLDPSGRTMYDAQAEFSWARVTNETQVIDPFFFAHEEGVAIAVQADLPLLRWWYEGQVPHTHRVPDQEYYHEILSQSFAMIDSLPMGNLLPEPAMGWWLVVLVAIRRKP